MCVIIGALQRKTLDDKLIDEEVDIKSKLEDLKKAEESYYRKRSRKKWIQDGDRNIKLYHSIVKASNAISELYDVNGNAINNQEKIESYAIEFFEKL